MQMKNQKISKPDYMYYKIPSEKELEKREKFVDKFIKRRKSLFKSIHRGICKTCHKRKFLNIKNECFFCWDKAN